MPFVLYSATQQQLKHHCFINIFFLLKTKHNVMPDTMKEKSALSQLKRLAVSVLGEHTRGNIMRISAFTGSLNIHPH